MDNGPPVAFYVASLLGTFRKPKVTNITTGIFTVQLCHKIGGLNEKNVIGQFEKQFQDEIAMLDDDDELRFDEDDLM